MNATIDLTMQFIVVAIILCFAILSYIAAMDFFKKFKSTYDYFLGITLLLVSGLLLMVFLTLIQLIHT